MNQRKPVISERIQELTCSLNNRFASPCYTEYMSMFFCIFLTALMSMSLIAQTGVGCDGARYRYRVFDDITVEYEDKWIPCVFEFKNMPSYNKLKKIYTSLQSNNGETGTIVYSQRLTGVEAKMANGNTYAVFEAEMGDKVGHLEEDSDKLIVFSDWITRHDKYVTDEWSKSNAGSFSASDADLVSSMVNVEETS